MFCAQRMCVLPVKACLLNKRIALQAIKKLLAGETISYLEIDRVIAFKQCKLRGDPELGEMALQAIFDNLVRKLERSRA